MFDLYRPGSSILHRAPAGAKVLSLAVIGTAVFLLDSFPITAGLCTVVLLMYPLSGLPMRSAWSQIRPALWILIAIFVAQGLISGWGLAAFVVTRFAALLLLAGLVVLTTRVSDMIDSMERGLTPLRYIGANPAKISLALSLALRFIPVLAQITKDVREAQKTRGLERNIIAVAIPLVIRTLRMSEDIADAIEARGYAP